MITRSTVVTAAVAAAAALAATGITYASAATSEPAQATQAVQQAVPASALGGGDVGKGNEGKGNEGRGNEGRGNEGRGNEGRGHFEGRIHINERTYADELGGCVTVVSGLGSNSLNIRNDSRRTVEVFRGATCDNGAPIATVGPHSSSDGVFPGHVKGGVWVKNGVVGSFRVIERHFDEGREGGGRDW
ncbi:hypothetical protein PUR34_22680 [Streptomyces sp. JV185]|uniref:hypothetical protein n=1 Tax=Streptomyces sp. JV185 TaxID=858638 RepID=UPI002E78957D|nr:hypothetical protein [Streptomyces sp. JV185]MEE1770867.1 hypothetical protein [Streptomyces sp. JV185]